MALDVAALLKIARGENACATGVAGVAGVAAQKPHVADVARYASKSPRLRQLRPLRVKNTSYQNDFSEGVAAHVAAASSHVAAAYPAACDDDQAEADGKNRAAVRAGITDRFCACGLLATVAIFDPAPNRGGRRWLCRECFNDRTMGAE